MDIIVSSKDKISSLQDLSFSDKFVTALKRVRFNGKQGMTQSEFAKAEFAGHTSLSPTSISRVLSNGMEPSDRVRRKMEYLVDMVYDD